MAVKSSTAVLELTKYNAVDIPEELNVISENAQKVDDYAGEVNSWREQTDATLDEFRSEIETLQPQTITALENKVNANASAIANLTQDVSRLDTRLNGAEIDITNLQDEQGVQNVRLSAIEAEQIVQNDNISALSDEIDDVTNQLITYETTTDARLNIIEGDIENLKTEDETITTQLATHAAELANHETRITALEESGVPAGVLTRIENLETNVAQLNTDISAIDSSITQLQTDVSANSNDINQLESDVSQLASDFTSLQSSLSALTDRVAAIEALLVAGINTTSNLAIYAADEPSP